MFKTIFSYAFRPFYAVASIYVTVIILLWYPLGYQGNLNYPSLLWHGHEMIYGFAGAVIVGFLLTAVSNWTNSKPTSGYPLLLLLVFWLLARICIYLPTSKMIVLSTIFDSCFYLFSAFFILKSLIRANNRANILVPIALLLFGASNILFSMSLLGMNNLSLLSIMQIGILGIVAFIGLIGSRVIPFFTSITLQKENQFSKPMTVIAFITPLFMMVLMSVNIAPILVFSLGVVVLINNLWQLYRWWDRKILQHPLIWVLHISFFLMAIGVLIMSYSYTFDITYLPFGTHIIAIGSIALIIQGMMSRTALGHTGRAMVLPKKMKYAFILIIISMIIRSIASFYPANALLLTFSSLSFAFAFLLYLYYYLPILLTPSR